MDTYAEGLSPSGIIISSDEPPTGESSCKSAPAPFPRRLKLDTFPHPPPPGSARLPATLDNAQFLLSECGVVVSYDVFKKRPQVLCGGMSLADSDLVSLANLNGMAPNWLLDFVLTLARRNEANPVAAWIKSNDWDGTDRLQALYQTIHVEHDYPEHVRDLLLYRWLLSCAAAALHPSGFHTRGVLTLQGPQGAGKTSWIARLVPQPMRADWVKLDHHLDAHNKDSVFLAVTHWVTEIGELDSSFKKDVARIKGFLTNDCDKLRLPYARSPIELPRRTVFAATVNEWHFLIDQTGNSRWWTIATTKLDYGHEIDMQQVFAQLAVDYQKGEPWWLNPEEEQQLEALNNRHRAVSVIEERVRDRLVPENTGGKSMTALQVLQEVGVNYPTNAQCRECGTILRTIYGPPRRINGRDKWRVAIVPEDAWRKPLPDEEDDAIY